MAMTKHPSSQTAERMHVYEKGRWSICPKRDKFANQILTAADSQTPGLSDKGPAGRSAAQFTSTEQHPVSTSPSIAKQDEAPEGPGRAAYKPLMRKRTGHDEPAPIGIDGDTLEASGTTGSRTAGEGIAYPSPLNDHAKPALVVSPSVTSGADNGPLASSIIHSLPHFANKLDDRMVDRYAALAMSSIRALTMNGIWTTWNHDRTLRILRHIRSTISERIESMEERAEEVKD
jgi:hypothetical protein